MRQGKGRREEGKNQRLTNRKNKIHSVDIAEQKTVKKRTEQRHY
jgi:hypothetical protein